MTRLALRHHIHVDLHKLTAFDHLMLLLVGLLLIVGVLALRAVVLGSISVP